MKNYILILISVFLNASAQLFLKRGMLVIGDVSFSFTGMIALVRDAAINISIIAGMISYAISILLWMVVLSKINVSIAYPLLSIGYIYTTIMAYFFFNEPLTIQKIAAIFIICCGVILLTYNNS